MVDKNYNDKKNDKPYMKNKVDNGDEKEPLPVPIGYRDKTEVRTGKEIGNLWMNNWFKSNNYKVRSYGFLIDGIKNYIEANRIYIGEGGFAATAAAKMKSIGEVLYKDIATFTDDDLTPSVKGGNVFLTATGHGAARDITAFDDGAEGQMLLIIGAANANATTVKDGANLKINGDFVEEAEAALLLISDGTNWYELARRPVALLKLAADLDTNGYNILFDSGKGIFDENNNELILFEVTGAAITYLKIKNDTTGQGVEILAEGGTNEDLLLTPKGTGAVSVKNVTNYENNVTADDDLVSKKYFDDNQFSNKVYTDLTSQTISNSEAVTTLYSFTIPGGTFGTANGIHIYIPISSFRFDANFNNSFGLKFTYDDTDIFTILVDTGASDVMDVVTKGFAEAYIYANGATNAQVGRGYFLTHASKASATKSYSGASEYGSGTSAEDSTGDLTFYIKGDFDTAATAALNAITCTGCFVTKIA